MIMQKMQPRRRDRGFTLMEVLVAVGFVTALLAVGIPKYQEHLRRTRDAARLMKMDNVRKMLLMYYAEKSHFPLQPAAPTACKWEDVGPAGSGAYSADCLKELSGYGALPKQIGGDNYTSFLYADYEYDASCVPGDCPMKGAAIQTWMETTAYQGDHCAFNKNGVCTTAMANTLQAIPGANGRKGYSFCLCVYPPGTFN